MRASTARAGLVVRISAGAYNTPHPAAGCNLAQLQGNPPTLSHDRNKAELNDVIFARLWDVDLYGGDQRALLHVGEERKDEAQAGGSSSVHLWIKLGVSSGPGFRTSHFENMAS